MSILMIPDLHQQARAVMVGIDRPMPVPLRKLLHELRTNQHTKPEGVLAWPAYNPHLPDQNIHDYNRQHLLHRLMLEQ